VPIAIEAFGVCVGSPGQASILAFDRFKLGEKPLKFLRLHRQFTFGLFKGTIFEPSLGSHHAAHASMSARLFSNASPRR
jgi:hypothetical protein